MHIKRCLVVTLDENKKEQSRAIWQLTEGKEEEENDKEFTMMSIEMVQMSI